MKKGYNIDTLTSADSQEIVEAVGVFIENYNGVIYRENVKTNPSRNVIEILFDLIFKQKDEHDEVMQLIVKLLMNSLYGEQIQKDIEGEYSCKSENWMSIEYDESVKDYWRFSSGICFVKLAQDEGLEGDVKKLNTMPLPL